MIDEKRIAEIRERCEAATDGPWDWVCDDPHALTLGTKGYEQKHHVLSAYRCESCQKSGNRCLWPEKHDADFIAHARQDIPWLLEHLAELDKKIGCLRDGIEGYKAEIERYKDWCEYKNEINVKLSNEAHKVNAEIERLREAQRWIGGQNEL